MFTAKVLLATAAICSALAAIFLLWNESEVTCGYTITKVYETLFILVSITLTKEATSIRIDNE